MKMHVFDQTQGVFHVGFSNCISHRKTPGSKSFVDWCCL